MDKRDYGKRLANAIATQMRRKGITGTAWQHDRCVARTISDLQAGRPFSYDVMARMAVILKSA
ncbi:MAG: hypothetical protein ACLVJ6_16945 [Merdibacter sp.]